METAPGKSSMPGASCLPFANLQCLVVKQAALGQLVVMARITSKHLQVKKTNTPPLPTPNPLPLAPP